MRESALSVLCVVSFCFASSLSLCAVAGEVAGRAQVLDGDSLIVGDQWVRLHGIAAPSLDMRCSRSGRIKLCGQEAKRALEGFVADQSLVCQTSRHREKGVVYGKCIAGDTDVSYWMVSNGWAVATNNSTLGVVQAAAREAKVNFWGNDFEGRSFTASYLLPEYLKPKYPKSVHRSRRHVDMVTYVTPEFVAEKKQSGRWDIRLTFAISDLGKPDLQQIESDAPAQFEQAIRDVFGVWRYVPPMLNCTYAQGVISEQTISLQLNKGKAAIEFSRVSHKIDGQNLAHQKYTDVTRLAPSRMVRAFRDRHIGGTYIVRFQLVEDGRARQPQETFGFPRGLMTTEAIYLAHMSRFQPGREMGCFRLDL